MTFQTGRRFFLHSSKLPPMLRTGGKPTVRTRTKQNPLYSRPYQLGILCETPSRNSTIPWGAIRTSTYNGPRCDNKGIKMCMSWWICSIPCAQSWVSKIQRNIWCQSIAAVCADTFRRNGVPRHLLAWYGISVCCQDWAEIQIEEERLWICE